jgi:predicted acetyltransferase
MYGVATEVDRSGLARILSHCFGFPAEDVPEWLTRASHENVRAYREGDALIGGLIVVPMGQYFGGRSVPMLGIAGVGIPPELRGQGAATKMMSECVREARASGYALSALYPATVALYRGVGYARAGARYEIKIAPGAAATRERSLRIERVADDDMDVRAVYSRYAARRPGFLDRGPYIWGRIFKPRKGSVESFKVIGDRGCEGYVAVVHKMGDMISEVSVNDLVALSKPAAARLLDLLAGYGSIASSIRWYGTAPDLLTSALPERRHDIRLTDYWMLRVCDVEKALTARGYAGEGALDLAIEDDVIKENSGRYKLRVRDGRASLERGGEGTFKIDVRGLAALYSGFHDARTLMELGDLETRDEHLATADSLFAGNAPAMSDFF